MSRRVQLVALLLTMVLPAAAFCQSEARASLAIPVRGVWLHPGFFGPDKALALEKMRATLDEYRKAGINTVIVLVKDTSGYVYFKSRTGVADPRWSWDFFGELLAEARKRDIQVHPWFCVFHETAIVGPVREHPEWLIQSPRREFVGSVNPALPAVRDYERGLMMEVATRGP